MIADPATKRLCVSRKSVPKQKGRIPLDELLAAHLASDDVRLAAHGLRRIFRGLDVDGRRETRPGRKTAEIGRREARRSACVWSIRLRCRPNRSHASDRLCARLATDAQTARLQLDAPKAVVRANLRGQRERGAIVLPVSPLHSTTSGFSVGARPSERDVLRSLVPVPIPTFPACGVCACSPTLRVRNNESATSAMPTAR